MQQFDFCLTKNYNQFISYVPSLHDLLVINSLILSRLQQFFIHLHLLLYFLQLSQNGYHFTILLNQLHCSDVVFVSSACFQRTNYNTQCLLQNLPTWRDHYKSYCFQKRPQTRLRHHAILHSQQGIQSLYVHQYICTSSIFGLQYESFWELVLCQPLQGERENYSKTQLYVYECSQTFQLQQRGYSTSKINVFSQHKHTMESIQDQHLESISIPSDLSNGSDYNSDQQLNALADDLDQQMNYVEAKYQKYKMIRQELFVRKNNLPPKQSQSSSSFSSASSIISSTSSTPPQDPLSQTAHKYSISTETLQMIYRKFKIFQSPRQDLTSEPLTLRKIGDDHDLTFETIENLYSHWKKQPEKQKERENQSVVSKERITILPTEQKLNEMRTQAVQQMLTDNPYMTQQQIFMELNKMNHLKSIKYGKFKQISRTIINKILNDSQFKQKKLRVLHPERNQPQNVELRHIFCKGLLSLLHKKYSLYFVDENTFEQFTARQCAWIKHNQSLTPKSSSNKYSLLALFDISGVAHWKISANCQQKYDDIEGIQELFLRAKDEKQENEQNMNGHHQKHCLIMDNCIMADQAKCKAIEKKMGTKLIFLPPCSAQINPIETWFQQLRLRIRKNSYNNDMDLFKTIHTLLFQYQTYDFKESIREAMNYVERGYRRDRF